MAKSFDIVVAGRTVTVTAMYATHGRGFTQTRGWDANTADGELLATGHVDAERALDAARERLLARAPR